MLLKEILTEKPNEITTVKWLLELAKEQKRDINDIIHEYNITHLNC